MHGYQAVEDQRMNNRSKDSHQASYIYTPPTKRRKSGHPSSRKDAPPKNTQQDADSLSFVPLLDGNEERSSVKLRQALFHRFWSSQELRLQAMFREADSEVSADVAQFIEHTSSETCNGRIPSGMLALGCNVSSIGRLVEKLRYNLRQSKSACLVFVESTDAPNLKTLLKTIIRLSISEIESHCMPAERSPHRTMPRTPAYDLDLLSACIRKNSVSKVVITLKDSEAFSKNVLRELLSLLWLWLDRIPLVLLFGVSTSVTHFEARLPRLTVNLLHGRHFDLQHLGDSASQCFFDLQTQREGMLWLGNRVTRSVTGKSENRFSSVEQFKNCLKYAYMSYFFANPLAILLAEDTQRTFQPELCQAIRNVPSFRRHIHQLLDSGDVHNAKVLLDDDALLSREASKLVREGQHKMATMLEWVGWLVRVNRVIKLPKDLNVSELISLVFSGKLSSSDRLESLLAPIKTMDIDELKAAFHDTPESLDELSNMLGDLGSRQGRQRSSSLPPDNTLKSTSDSTTEGGSMPLERRSESDEEYSRLLEELHTRLRPLITEKLIPPAFLPMHEAFIYDLPFPINFSFHPRCRYTIERALSIPFDYLARDSSETTALSEVQPAISILYQLHLESGCWINTHDLWCAFSMILGAGRDPNYDESASLALFYRALAELKMVGVLGNTRKKTDHLAKSAWMNF